MVMELKEWQENVFYANLNNLKGWVKSADTLYVVANDLLKSRIEGVMGLEAEPYSKIALMLNGLGIEVLLKAQIMFNERQDDNEFNLRLLKKIANHKLKKLVKRAGVELSDEENKLLGEFTDYIEWAGKYPVPKEISRIYTKVINEDLVRKSRSIHWVVRQYIKIS